jgi:hypothetical protein
MLTYLRVELSFKSRIISTLNKILEHINISNILDFKQQSILTYCKSYEMTYDSGMIPLVKNVLFIRTNNEVKFRKPAR